MSETQQRNSGEEAGEGAADDDDASRGQRCCGAGAGAAAHGGSKAAESAHALDAEYEYIRSRESLRDVFRGLSIARLEWSINAKQCRSLSSFTES